MPIQPMDPQTAKVLMAIFGLDPAQHGIIRGNLTHEGFRTASGPLEVDSPWGKLSMDVPEGFSGFQEPVRPTRSDSPPMDMDARKLGVTYERGEKIRGPEVRKGLGKTLEKTGRRVPVARPAPAFDPHVVSTALISQNPAEQTAALEHIRRTSNLFRNNIVTFLGAPAMQQVLMEMEEARTGVARDPIAHIAQAIAGAFQRAQAERDRVQAQKGVGRTE